MKNILRFIYRQKRKFSYLGTGIAVIIFLIGTFFVFQRQIQYSHAASISSLTDNSLVAAYSFTDGLGRDMSGNGNDATINGNQVVTGKLGSGLSFNGATDYLSVLNSASLNNFQDNHLTISFWINPQQSSQDSVVLGKFWSNIWVAPYYQYGIELARGNMPTFYVGLQSGLKGASMGKTIPYGKWSHIAVVFNGSQVVFYLNGNLVRKQSFITSITPRDTNLQIGADENIQQFFKGTLDEIRIYNQALTQTEIQNEMNSEITKISPSPSVIPTAVVTEMPTPTQQPSSTIWPSKLDTGWEHTGVSLTKVTSLYYAEIPGEVLDAKDFLGGVEVKANNVTIKRSRVSGKGSGPGAGIWIDQGVSGTVIEDVEVTSDANADITNESQIVDRAITAFKTTGTVMRRVYAHKIIRGLQYGCDTLIEDSYIDDEINPSTAHMSAIGGETCPNFKLTVRHNTIGLAQNDYNSAALLFYPPQTDADKAAGAQHVTIFYDNNFIYGGTYCMWISSDPQISGTLTATNNIFSTKYHPDCGNQTYAPGLGEGFPYFADHVGTEGNLSISWSNNIWSAPGMAKDGQQVNFVYPHY